MTQRIKDLIPKIIELYKSGDPSKTIAKKLNINVKTVLFYLKKKLKLRNRKKDLLGQRFGRLLVTKLVGSDKNRKILWECLCDCGNRSITRTNDLLRFKVISCGCFRNEAVLPNIKKAYEKSAITRFKGVGDLSGLYINRVKRGALDRKLEYSITPEYMWSLYLKQECKCALTQIPIFLNKHKRIGEQTASLDRIDSQKGYIEGNVQWVHKDINQMKWNFGQEKFIEYCKLIASNKN